MSTLTTNGADELILLDHHPDLFGRPEARPGLVAAENRRAALTWNVFRTLELIAPSFWLRRFRARLDWLTSLEPGTHSMSVRLWAALPTTGNRRLHEPVCVDAIIDTDTAVYGVMTFAGSDLAAGDSSLARPDAVVRVIDAVSQHAGVRDCYIALITSQWSDTPVGTALIERYRGSREMLLRRLPHRRDGLANLRGIGRMTWQDVAGVIHDCASGQSLTDLERLAASRTRRWLDLIGIRPSD
jgi:hypothetical protein